MSPRQTTSLITALLLALGWFGLDRTGAPTSHPTTSDESQAPAMTQAAPPVVAELQRAGPAPEPVGSTEPGMVCPDGTTLPPLNGVNQRVKMQWHQQGDFAPVVATLTNNGQDYYQHADGTLTSVVHVINQATGQPNIMSQVWTRGEARPTRVGH